MIRTVAALTAVTLLVVAAALVFVIREQRSQAVELARLTKCVEILERNQGKPDGDLFMGCPIYD